MKQKLYTDDLSLIHIAAIRLFQLLQHCSLQQWSLHHRTPCGRLSQPNDNCLAHIEYII